MEYLGFLACICMNFLAWRAPLSVPLSQSVKPRISHLKYRTVGSSPLIRWVINLRRRFLLLPMRIIDFWALASSYAPSFSGSFCKFSRVNLRHLPFIGIIHLPLMIDSNSRLAYPLEKRLEGIANAKSVREGNGRNSE